MAQTSWLVMLPKDIIMVDAAFTCTKHKLASLQINTIPFTTTHHHHHHLLLILLLHCIAAPPD
jgi:hypothetical protein